MHWRCSMPHAEGSWHCEYGMGGSVGGLLVLELGPGLLVPVGLVVLVTTQLDTPKQIPLRSRLVGHEFWPWTVIVQAVAAVTEPEGQPLTVPRKGPIAPKVKSRHIDW